MLLPGSVVLAMYLFVSGGYSLYLRNALSKFMESETMLLEGSTATSSSVEGDDRSNAGYNRLKVITVGIVGQ